ncbi:MAG: hypothetical protein ABI573_12190 [Chloroflexota bacterium]
MTSNHLISSASGDHAGHERLAIAAFASGDAAGRERETAQILISTCKSCQLLNDDLRSIMAAVRVLPPDAAALHRDFRLTTADARRLTRGHWLRLLVRPFGEVRRSVIQPAAGALMALGLAVIVLSGPSLMFPGGAASSAPEAALNPSRGVSIQDLASPSASGAGPGAPGYLGAPTGTVAPNDAGGTPPAGDGGKTSRDNETLESIGKHMPWSIVGLALVSTGAALLILRRVALRVR